MKNSYIVAINNTFELATNFFERLLLSTSSNDEIVVIFDGVNNVKLIDYINSITTKHNHIIIHFSDKQEGYSKANNRGVNLSTGDNLIFLNSDAFPENDCIQKLVSKLRSRDTIGAVQPLLLYPQTNLVQSTGHLFIDYESKHVFQMRKPSDRVIKQEGRRQSLTTALCVIKREVFEMTGGFDEYYYNSHEGMELTLKITLMGYDCIYCPEAVAYHCSGGTRDHMKFDQTRQKTHFYNTWSQKIQIDLLKYLKQQTNSYVFKCSYYVINLSRSHIWPSILKELQITYHTFIDSNAKYESEINLYQWFPYHTLVYPGSYIFLCENISQLKYNVNWASIRNNPTDMIMDLNGNITNFNEYLYY